MAGNEPRCKERVDSELNADRSYLENEGFDSEADASFGLAAALDRLSTLASEVGTSILCFVITIVRDAELNTVKRLLEGSHHAEDHGLVVVLSQSGKSRSVEKRP